MNEDNQNSGESNGKGLKTKFDNLNPTSKKIAKALIIVFGFILLYGVFSIAFRGDNKVVRQEKEQSFFNADMTGSADKELSDKIVIINEFEQHKAMIDAQVGKLDGDISTMKDQLSAISNQLGALRDNPPTVEDNYPAAPGQPGRQPAAGTAVKIDTVGGIRRISVQQAISDNQTTVKKNNYFPTTTLLKGVLLGGLYAPTLSKGKSSPHPAFIRVDDLSILPNDLRRDIEGCEFMGEAYGELSDSRVHIRLTKLACTAYDGSLYFDGDVKGVVFGEDGTLGVPGVTLANFNEILATSSFVYFLGGLGSAMKDVTSTTIVSAEGNTQTYMSGDSWNKAGKTALSGFGEGLNQGFTRIGDYYMDILDDMVPVVQINGGRYVEVKLTEGVELKLQDNDWTWDRGLEVENMLAGGR